MRVSKRVGLHFGVKVNYDFKELLGLFTCFYRV